MEQNLESVRIIATTSVQSKEAELTKKINDLEADLRGKIEESVRQMDEDRNKLIGKLEKQYKDIQIICCNYFDKYDKELSLVKDGLSNSNDKYSHWVKKLIEPSSFNDARLFALETRFEEEEEMRFAQIETFKDLFKKLVYTFEQDKSNDVEHHSLPSLIKPMDRKVTQSFNFGTKMAISPESNSSDHKGPRDFDEHKNAF